MLDPMWSDRESRRNAVRSCLARASAWQRNTQYSLLWRKFSFVEKKQRNVFPQREMCSPKEKCAPQKRILLLEIHVEKRKLDLATWKNCNAEKDCWNLHVERLLYWRERLLSWRDRTPEGLPSWNLPTKIAVLATWKNENWAKFEL